RIASGDLLEREDQAGRPTLRSGVQLGERMVGKRVAALTYDGIALLLREPQVMPADHFHGLIGAQARHDRRWIAAADERDTAVGRRLRQRYADGLVKQGLRRDFMVAIQHQRKGRAKVRVQGLKVTPSEW